MKMRQIGMGWPVRGLLAMAVIALALYSSFQSPAPVAADQPMLTETTYTK